MRRFAAFIGIILVSVSMYGQKRPAIENLADFDERMFHFGFILGYNKANFVPDFNTANYSLGGDSLIGVNIEPQPGFNLGIVSSMKLTPSFRLRFVPSLSFQERKVNYTYRLPGDTTETLDQRVESTFLDFPLYFKFRTYRSNNFAAFFLAGVKYSLDMASQKDVTGDDILKIRRPDFSYEVGVGTDFFLQYFKFGLELKYSRGLPNVLIQENNRWSRPLNSLNNSMWLLSITFEG